MRCATLTSSVCASRKGRNREQNVGRAAGFARPEERFRAELPYPSPFRAAGDGRAQATEGRRDRPPFFYKSVAPGCEWQKENATLGVSESRAAFPAKGGMRKIAAAAPGALV